MARLETCVTGPERHVDTRASGLVQATSTALRALAGVILALALSPAAAAGEIYKWQDEAGRWHYSDRQPPGGVRAEVLGLPNEPRTMVTVRRGGERHRPEHFFFNRYHGPAQVELYLGESDNVRSDPPLPARFVLPGNAEAGLVTLDAVDPTRAFSYRLGYSLVPGPPRETLPDDLDYYPPFGRDQRFPISQGIDDRHTHVDDANRYAVDIGMPLGTPVLAARGGRVMDTENGFADHGRQEERFLPRANFVRILHDDGTMAVYAHLQSGSVRVQPGMRVPAGHWIANSGNSGYSSGPHLHFVVQMNIGMALESLPLRFKRPEGGVMDPDRPQMLRGVLPSGR